MIGYDFFDFLFLLRLSLSSAMISPLVFLNLTLMTTNDLSFRILLCFDTYHILIYCGVTHTTPHSHRLLLSVPLPSTHHMATFPSSQIPPEYSSLDSAVLFFLQEYSYYYFCLHNPPSYFFDSISSRTHTTDELSFSFLFII
ncbi:hypothetical protein BDN72DRAFT_688795 [Pluteus cervinus]|uniref:Uncharacterized protein n=1 Tax=Pluteus cervinus TaxID=181527 RepID=A0ACD3ARC1_9AGAR|nr:hypothetical protein BDN72DRAFT_688795 [Pluteus cervinus]